LFEIILAVVLFILTIIIFAYFDWNIEIAAIIIFITTFSCILVPEKLFDKYASYSEPPLHSYELIENTYIQPQSGKTSGIIVSYIDEDGYLKKYNIANSKIIYYDGIPKIEFVEFRWSFLRKSKPIVYLNK